MFGKFEDFLFDRFPGFQRIANVVDYYLGMTHVTLAIAVVIGGAAFAGARAMQLATMAYEPRGWIMLFASGLLVILFLWQCQVLEGMLHGQGKFRNPLRIHSVYKFFRFILLTACVAGIVKRLLSEEPRLWVMAGPIGVTVGLYFLACDKLPPGPRFFDRFFGGKTA